MKFNKKIRTVLAASALIVVLGGCNNLFQVGLGETVDVEPPEISRTSPSMNAFLTGTASIQGVVTDDQRVEKVEIRFRKDDGTPGDWKSVSTLHDGSEEREWEHEFDTTDYPDGTVRLDLRVTDSVGKQNSLNDQEFRIDNNPPVVLVDSPETYKNRTFNTYQNIQVSAADEYNVARYGVKVTDASGNLLPRHDVSGKELPNPYTEETTVSPWEFEFNSYEYYSDAERAVLNGSQTGAYPDKDFQFHFFATDAAGQTSEIFFHREDVAAAYDEVYGEVRTRNAGQVRREVEQLSGYDSDFRSELMLYRKRDASGERLGLYFDEGGDLPRITFANPGWPVIGLNDDLRIIVEDDDGIASGFPKYKVWRVGDEEPSSWKDVDSYTDRIASISLPDGAAGQLNIQVWARDIGSDEEMAERIAETSFTVTSGVPRVQIDEPASGTYASGAVTIRGTAEHEVGIDEIRLSFNDGVDFPYVIWSEDGSGQGTSAPDGDNRRTWEVTLDTQNPPADWTASDGTHYLHIAAYAGSEAGTRELMLVVDNQDPVISFDIPAENDTVNKVFRLRGTADDNFLLERTEYQVRSQGDPWPGLWVEFTDGVNPTPYSWSDYIDTRLYSNGVPLEIQVRTTDRAGNERLEVLTLSPDQSTDNPTIDFTDLDDTVGTAGVVSYGDANSLEENASVVATVSDDDSVDGSTIEIRVDGGAWTSVGATKDAQNVTFNYSLESLSDGEHFFELRFSDLASAKSQLPGVTDGDPDYVDAVETTVGPVYFVINTAAPELVITNPSETGSFINDNTLVFQGTASDGNGLTQADLGAGDVDYIEVKPPSAASWTDADVEQVEVAGDGTWSYETDLLVSGQYEYDFRATDRFNRSREVSFLFLVDRDSPELTITGPTENEGVDTKNYTITGTAFDEGRGVQSIEYSTDSTDGFDGSWDTITVGRSWTKPGVDLSGDGTEGDRTLWVRASDGLNPATKVSVLFFYDESSPTIRENEINTTDTEYTNANSVSISGTLDDTNAVKASDGVTISAALDGTEITAPTVTYTPDGTDDGKATWESTLDLIDSNGQLADGKYVFTITGRDVADKTDVIQRTVRRDTTAPEATIAALSADYYTSQISVEGTASDDGGSVSGVEKVEYQLQTGTTPADPDGSWTAVTGNSSWFSTIDLSSTGADLAEGEYTLYVRATDRAGNENDLASAAFTIDRENPVIAVDAAYDGTVYRDGEFMINGTVSDSLELDANPISVSVDGPLGDVTLGETGYELAYDDAATPPTWSQTVPIDDGDGDYTVTITATDNVGRTSEVERTVTVDTEPPTLPVGEVNLTSGDVINNTSYNVTGTSADTGTGVEKVEYRVDDGTWADANGTNDWTVVLEDLTEGLGQTLELRATDRAEREVTKSIDFNVDTADPTISAVNLGTDTEYRNADFDITFTLADTHDLASYTVKRDDATILTDSEDNPVESKTISGTSKTITVSQAIDDLDEATYEYEITVTDIVGKTSSVTRTVVADTQSPILEVTSPSENEGVGTSQYTLRGTLTDDGGKGIDSFEYSLDYTDDGDDTNDTWEPIDPSFSWSVPNIDFSNGGEGPKSVWFRASDGLNSVTETEVNFFYDTQSPTISETAIDSTDTEYTNADSIPISGDLTDSNAVKASDGVTISATLDGTEITAPTVTYTQVDGENATWESTLDLFDSNGDPADGKYVFTITGRDVADKTDVIQRTVRRDTTDPSVTLNTDLSGWQDSTSLALDGTASDDGSGLTAVEYRVNGGSWNLMTGSATWSGGVAFDAGSNTLDIRARDRAGNTSTLVTETVDVDTSAPSGEVTTPSDLTKVNGQSDLSVTLTAADTSNETDNGSGVASVLLKANSKDFSSGYEPATLSTGDANSGTWTADIPAADLLALSDGQRNIHVYIEDGVGQGTYLSFPVVVDKTAPDLEIDSHSEHEVVNKEIVVSGTASDTQGLDPTTPVEAHIWNVTGGSWEAITPINGSFNWEFNLNTETYDTDDYDVGGADGRRIRLRVTARDEAGNTTENERELDVDQNSDRPVVRLNNIDPEGGSTLKLTTTIFGSISDDDGSLQSLAIKQNPVDAWTTVPISGGTWEYEVTGDDGAKSLYFQVDDSEGTVFDTTNADTLNQPRLLVDDTDPANPVYADGAVDFSIDTVPPEIGAVIRVDRSGNTDWTEASAADLTTNMPFGGSTGQFRLRIEATDANGINSVLVSIPGDGADPPIEATATAIGGDIFETGLIDISALDDGARVITTTVKDSSELSSTTTRTVIIDNTEPDVQFVSPRYNVDTVSGVVEVVNDVQDDGSGIESIEYNYGYDYQDVGVDRAWIPAGGSLFRPTITFDGTGDNPDRINDIMTATPDALQPHVDDGIWQFPVMIRVTDKAGNVYESTPADYYLMFDPTGEIPSVEIAYPDPDNTNRVMGGVIRSFGSSSGKNPIQGVYMQIDVNDDTVFDANDTVLTDPGDPASEVDWYNGGQGRAVNGTLSWSQSINADGEFNPDTTPQPVQDVVSGEWYRIHSNVDADFTTIGADSNNVGHLFQATADGSGVTGTGEVSLALRTIRFRVRAVDDDGNQSAWSEPQVIMIDSDVPVFGATDAVTLQQGATERQYIDDIWLTGDWTLHGSVEHESGISDIQVSGDVNGSLSGNPDWFTTSGNRIVFDIPVDTTGIGTKEFKIEAWDDSNTSKRNEFNVRVNYDNDPPTLDPYTGETPVQQSNKTYQLSGSVQAPGSGFERVAFYFSRGDVADERVYNPMEPQGSNRTDMTGLVMEDGLPRLEILGGNRPTEYKLQHTSIENNLNVREGGIVKIGGFDRTIVSVDHVTGTIEWAEALSTAVTDAWIAYAMVVDNFGSEIPQWDGDTLTEIIGDDGDGMAESVERAGDLYTWSANIDSRNIPDGPVDIRYVAYDQSGNYAEGSVATSIQNNRPLLASATLATDLTGDGNVDTGQGVFFSALDGDGNEQAVVTLDTADYELRGRSSILFEVVGGNDELQYVFTQDTEDGTQVRDLTTMRADADADVTPIEVSEAELGTIGEGNQTFVFKIWDSTEETTIGVDSQWARVTVPLTVRVLDSIAPYASVNPFFWNSADDNSLYQNSREEGHIEIGPNLNTGVTELDDVDPKVSGKVTVRGSAYDDQRIETLYLAIDDFDFTGAPSTRTEEGVEYAEVASYAGGTWTPHESFADDGWAVSVDDVSIDQSGHRISWQLDWNSAEMTGVVGLDKGIRVLTVDKGDNPSTAGTPAANTLTGTATRGGQTTAEVTPDPLIEENQLILFGSGQESYAARIVSYDSDTGQIGLDRAVDTAATAYEIHLNNHHIPSEQVDVVPYIRGITTELQSNDGGLKDQNIRSTSGKYAIRSGAVNDFMSIYGFNLEPITDGVRITPSAYPSGLNGTVLQGNPLQFAVDSTDHTKLVVSNNSGSSGYLAIIGGTAVNPVPSLNNDNENASSYNQEYDEVSTRNRIRTDDRYLEFYDVTGTGITNATYPNMLMVNNEPYWGYVQSGADFDLQVRRGVSDADNTPIVRTLAADQLAMARDDGGRYHMISVTNFNNGRMHYFNNNFATFYQGANGYDAGGNNGASDPYWAGFDSGTRSYTRWGNNNAVDLDSVNYDPGLQLGRYTRPVLRVDGDSSSQAGAAMYLIYFDTMANELLFRNWRVGDGMASGTADLYGTYTSTLDDVTGESGDNTRKTISPTASEHFNMVVTSQNYVVIGYYEQENTRFVVRHSVDTNGDPVAIDGSNPGGNVLWSAPIEVAQYKGWYPSMLLDSAGRLHIAMYDTTGANMSYALMDSYTDTTPEVVTVDNFNSVGYYSDIRLDSDGKPAIAYYSVSETGTRDAIRLARYNGAAGTALPGVDAQGFATGNWEVKTVPVGSVPRGAQSSFLKVNLGFTTADIPIVGYAGDELEYSQPLDEIN